MLTSLQRYEKIHNREHLMQIFCKLSIANNETKEKLLAVNDELWTFFRTFAPANEEKHIKLTQ